MTSKGALTRNQVMITVDVTRMGLLQKSNQRGAASN